MRVSDGSQHPDPKRPCPNAELFRARAALDDADRVIEPGAGEVLSNPKHVDIELSGRDTECVEQIVLVDPAARSIILSLHR